MRTSGGRGDGGVSIVEQQSGPASTVSESMFRWDATADLAALTTQVLYLCALPLAAGQIVANLTWVSGATPAGVPTNQWSALFDPSRVQKAISADATSTAWAANTAITFAMTSAYTVLSSGLYYAGLMVKATTVPTLRGAVAPGNTVIFNVAPKLCGTADGSLTNPASCPGTAAAITTTANLAYCYAT